MDQHTRPTEPSGTPSQVRGPWLTATPLGEAATPEAAERLTWSDRHGLLPPAARRDLLDRAWRDAQAWASAAKKAGDAVWPVSEPHRSDDSVSVVSPVRELTLKDLLLRGDRLSTRSVWRLCRAIVEALIALRKAGRAAETPEFDSVVIRVGRFGRAGSRPRVAIADLSEQSGEFGGVSQREQAAWLARVFYLLATRAAPWGAMPPELQGGDLSRFLHREDRWLSLIAGLRGGTLDLNGARDALREAKPPRWRRKPFYATLASLCLALALGVVGWLLLPKPGKFLSEMRPLLTERPGLQKQYWITLLVSNTQEGQAFADNLLNSLAEIDGKQQSLAARDYQAQEHSVRPQLKEGLEHIFAWVDQLNSEQLNAKAANVKSSWLYKDTLYSREGLPRQCVELVEILDVWVALRGADVAVLGQSSKSEDSVASVCAEERFGEFVSHLALPPAELTINRESGERLRLTDAVTRWHRLAQRGFAEKYLAASHPPNGPSGRPAGRSSGSDARSGVSGATEALRSDVVNEYAHSLDRLKATLERLVQAQPWKPSLDLVNTTLDPVLLSDGLAPGSGDKFLELLEEWVAGATGFARSVQAQVRAEELRSRLVTLDRLCGWLKENWPANSDAAARAAGFIISEAGAFQPAYAPQLLRGHPTKESWFGLVSSLDSGIDELTRSIESTVRIAPDAAAAQAFGLLKTSEQPRAAAALMRRVGGWIGNCPAQGFIESVRGDTLVSAAECIEEVFVDKVGDDMSAPPLDRPHEQQFKLAELERLLNDTRLWSRAISSGEAVLTAEGAETELAQSTRSLAESWGARDSTSLPLIKAIQGVTAAIPEHARPADGATAEIPSKVLAWCLGGEAGDAPILTAARHAAYMALIDRDNAMSLTIPAVDMKREFDLIAAIRLASPPPAWLVARNAGILEKVEHRRIANRIIAELMNARADLAGGAQAAASRDSNARALQSLRTRIEFALSLIPAWDRVLKVPGFESVGLLCETGSRLSQPDLRAAFGLTAALRLQALSAESPNDKLVDGALEALRNFSASGESGGSPLERAFVSLKSAINEADFKARTQADVYAELAQKGPGSVAGAWSLQSKDESKGGGPYYRVAVYESTELKEAAEGGGGDDGPNSRAPTELVFLLVSPADQGGATTPRPFYMLATELSVAQLAAVLRGDKRRAELQGTDDALLARWRNKQKPAPMPRRDLQLKDLGNTPPGAEQKLKEKSTICGYRVVPGDGASDPVVGVTESWLESDVVVERDKTIGPKNEPYLRRVLAAANDDAMTKYWTDGWDFAGGDGPLRPTLQHPAGCMSYVQALAIARAAGCEVPTERQWKEALDSPDAKSETEWLQRALGVVVAQEAPVPQPIPNLSDKKWSAHMKSTPARQSGQEQLAEPAPPTDFGAFLALKDPDQATTRLIEDDGFVWYRRTPSPALVRSHPRFYDIIGNLAEWVSNESEPNNPFVAGLSAVTPLDAVLASSIGQSREFVQYPLIKLLVKGQPGFKPNVDVWKPTRQISDIGVRPVFEVEPQVNIPGRLCDGLADAILGAGP